MMTCWRLGLRQKRHVPIGEGHAGVVADAAHDEVIADEKRILHRAGRNDARLADRAVDEEKHQADPEPGDDLALKFLVFTGTFASSSFFFFSDFMFHHHGRSAERGFTTIALNSLAGSSAA